MNSYQASTPAAAAPRTALHSLPLASQNLPRKTTLAVAGFDLAGIRKKAAGCPRAKRAEFQTFSPQHRSGNSAVRNLEIMSGFRLRKTVEESVT